MVLYVSIYLFLVTKIEQCEFRFKTLLYDYMYGMTTKEVTKKYFMSKRTKEISK